MKIFHSLPINTDPCGGIKVVYQLSEIERELGYDSFIVFPTVLKVPDWFKHACTIIDEAHMHKYADKKKDLIVGTEDIEPIVRSGFQNKVAYIQGECWVHRSQPYKGIDIWFSSEFNENALPHLANHNVSMVSPFIDKSVFYYDNVIEKHDIYIQERKDGEKVRQKLEKISGRSIKLIPMLNEQSFAEVLRKTDIFIGHSYPEGFGLPPLEAMACSCITVSFTGGGGTDYMKHGVNCFIAPDGNYEAMGAMLDVAVNLSPMEISDMEREMKLTVALYNRERTKFELREALSSYEN